MTTPYANIGFAAPTDFTSYANAAAMPAAEGDLSNVARNDPTPVRYNQAVFAVVTFTPVGLASASAYVVMQTSLDNVTWIDVAWCDTAVADAPTVYVMTGGVAGANAFRQSRAAGVAPSPSPGANQVPLGGLIRFVGKATVTGSGSSSSSSSAAPGTGPAMNVTIRLKQLGLK